MTADARLHGPRLLCVDGSTRLALGSDALRKVALVEGTSWALLDKGKRERVTRSRLRALAWTTAEPITA